MCNSLSSKLLLVDSEALVRTPLRDQSSACKLQYGVLSRWDSYPKVASVDPFVVLLLPLLWQVMFQHTDTEISVEYWLHCLAVEVLLQIRILNND